MEKKGIIVTVLIVSGFLTVLFLPGYSRLQDLKEEKEVYERRVALLEKYNVELEQEIERMKEDPAYLEKKAREKLGVVRKGEVVYRPEN